MAQRSTPARRIPGEPLTGILRTVAYQARYSNRRRGDIPTITSSLGRAASAASAAVQGVNAIVAQSVALNAAYETEAEALARSETPPDLKEEVPATPVANDAATLATDETGIATWTYDDRGAVPVVVATAVADQPAVATVSSLSATSATVHVWGLTGEPMAGALVSVVALWP